MDDSTRINLIHKLESKIHNCLKEYISHETPIALLDFPDIKNCGDSAIWLGEIAYLKKYYDGKTPDYVSRMADFSASSLRRRIPPEGPVFIHGGGNFGDIWLGHQIFRENMLKKLKGRKIIQLPQSIHFNDPKRVEATARAIDDHGNFVLHVRDIDSYHFAKKHFNCKVCLCPDMAFAIGPISRPKATVPILAMLRKDAERVNYSGKWQYSDIPNEDWIKEDRQIVNRTKQRAFISALKDMKPRDAKLRMFNAAANQRLMTRGIRQISRGNIILTDRLHVHICSLLLGIPHAVLDNNYGKIGRFINAFTHESNLFYQANSIEDAISWARSRTGSGIH